MNSQLGFTVTELNRMMRFVKKDNDFIDYEQFLKDVKSIDRGSNKMNSENYFTDLGEFTSKFT